MASPFFCRENAVKGFTLVELLVVVIILGILAAVAIPNFAGAQDRAKNSALQSSAHLIQQGIEQYSIDNNNTYGDNLSNTLFASGSIYVNDNQYPVTPWGTRQANTSDIAWVDKEVGQEEGTDDGIRANPTTRNHFGAISFRCTNATSVKDAYNLGVTGKRGKYPIRVLNLRN